MDMRKAKQAVLIPEKLPVPAFVCRDLAIHACNEAAAVRVGATSALDLLGRDITSLVSEGDRAHLQSSLRRAVAGELLPSIGVCFLCGETEQPTAALTIFAESHDGEPLVWILAGNPVPNLLALGSDWKFLRQVIDASSSLIFVKDREGRFLLANRTLASAYGLAVGEVEGRLNAELHSNEDEVRAFLAADREVMDTQETKLIIAEPVTYADGEVHWFTTTKTPLHLGNSRCDHVLGIGTNVDELKKVEAELLRLQQELEQRVASRTAELIEKKDLLHNALTLNQSILMNATSGILVYRSDGGCVLVNPAASQLTGGTASELLAQNFHELESWRQSGMYEAACRALREMEAVSVECRVTCTFGRTPWVLAQFAPFTIYGVVHLLVSIQDISEMREALLALEERERAFRSLADNVPDNVIRYDLEGRVLFLNRKLEETLGHAGDELFGKTLEERGDPVLIERYRNLNDTVRRVAATGIAASFEQRIPEPGGTDRFHLIRIVPESGADGRPQSVLAVGRDITEEKLNEERLRLAASVFHNTAEGVLITDPKGVILSVNPAFTTITGYSEAEALGKTPRILRSDHQSEDFYRAMWQSLLLEGHWEGEIWNRRRGGEAYLEWLTINRIDDPSGEPVRYVSVFHDITELRSKDEHIRHLAFHDALTGLPNRALMQDRLQHAINRCKREKTLLSVTFIDLDRFKGINDTLGHDVGDLLLIEVAKRIKERLRAMDTVARLGGDEFVVLMEDHAGADDCACLAQELLAEIARPIQIKEHKIEIGASLGLAFFPEDGDDPLELMKRADMAMYAAKSSGRHTYRFFQQQMLDRTKARLSLEMELRRAISRREFVLHYQPKIDLATGRLQGAEALIRWAHPQRGILAPADFIPIAEESGLIRDIGRWVLAEACRQMSRWRAAGSEIRLAVNVSMRQLGDERLAERIAELTSALGLAPEMLELELTESTVMADPEGIANLLAKLRAIGVTIAVDDFGTGYSSLAYLRRLPIDVLKIDRSFVMDTDHDEEDAQIVKTIVALGQALRLTMVAEGIETPSQAERLCAMGCQFGQGYWFAPPMPGDEFLAWCEQRKES